MWDQPNCAGCPVTLLAGRAWEDFVHREDELVTLVSPWRAREQGSP